MSEALIIRNDSAMSVAFTPQAELIKEAALTLSAVIGKVANAAEQEAAVSAQAALQRVVKLCIDAEEEAKRPLNDYRGRIIAARKKFLEDPLDELMRLSALIGDHQALELARVRAAEAAQKNEIAAAEKERQENLAKAKSLEEMAGINEQYARRVEFEPVRMPDKVKGQVVREEWDFTVTDLELLSRAHPNCVKKEPIRVEIKYLLSNGVTVHGVKAWPVIKSTVRLAPERKAIEA